MPIHQQILFDQQANLPDIILAVSPCRSGSTALMCAFHASGVPCYYQKIKEVLRYQLVNQTVSWHIPQVASSVIYAKETTGPFLVEEATFNPLTALIDAGYPTYKLHILIFGRDPLHTWASWHHHWGTRTNLDIYIASYKMVEKVRQQACTLGLSVTHLVYECFQEHDIKQIMSKVLCAMKLNIILESVLDWHTAQEQTFIQDNVPVQFKIDTLHDNLKRSESFQYQLPDETRLAHINTQERVAIRKQGLFNLYHSWAEQCYKDLELSQ